MLCYGILRSSQIPFDVMPMLTDVCWFPCRLYVNLSVRGRRMGLKSMLESLVVQDICFCRELCRRSLSPILPILSPANGVSQSMHLFVRC